MLAIAVRRFFVAILFAAGVGVGLTAASPASAITLSIAPATQTVALGSSVTADLTISGLGGLGAPSLGAFFAQITFDDNILAFDSVSYGSLLGDPASTLETDIVTTLGVGAVGLDEVSLLSGSALDGLQSASFVLATLTFTGSSSGASTLSLESVDLSDSGFPASTLSAEIAPGSVTVVPEPRSLLLLALGLSLVTVGDRTH